MRQRKVKVDNLVPFNERLSSSDKVILLFAIHHYGDLHGTIHAGNLPFLSRSFVTGCMKKLINAKVEADKLLASEQTTSTLKKYVNILDKLGVVNDDATKVTFSIYLSPKRLMRVFRDIESGMGINLPFFTEVNAGIRWQEFGKKYVSPMTQVKYVARLRPTLVASPAGTRTYDVTVAAEIADKAKEYLFERFA